jgi:threonyl-tRNA synthetase
MKLLLLHVDHIEFKAKQKTKVAEQVGEDRLAGRAEEALAAFIAVEKADERHSEEVVKRAAEEIEKVYSQVKAKRVVLYPYAHLSSSLAKPDFAVELLKSLEEELVARGYEVLRAPFGWYKAFELRCKGHPLSELSREISVEEREEKESLALKAEKKLKSEWYVLTPEGKLTPAESFDFSQHEGLKIFYEYETKGTRAVTEEPPHIRLMKEHELVDHEPGSDPGNLRWYPKGRLIKKLLEEHVTQLVLDYGAMEVETPVMYDFAHPTLSRYLHRFPARQYVVISDDKEYFLRFAACFGQYLMMHDMTISYRHLPLRLYELTHYSFRREQSGELAGLKRLRTFTMPDMHTLCRDMEQAKEEFLRQFKLSMRWMEELGLEYEVAIRFVRDFYEENEEFAKQLARLIGKPILIELWDKRFFYFVMKFEFSVNDAQNKAATLSTVQIDVENTKRFEITYVDESGERRHPLLLHASISGGIDRNLYALLEQAYLKSKRGEKPALPTWLCPTQVRIIPVSEQNLGYAKEVLAYFKKRRVRADLDDEAATLQKKIRNAEKEWIPYIVVVGAREQEGGYLTVRVRSTGEQVQLTKEELAERVEKENEGKPFAKLPLPERLSQRPKFRG